MDLIIKGLQPSVLSSSAICRDLQLPVQQQRPVSSSPVCDSVPMWVPNAMNMGWVVAVVDNILKSTQAHLQQLGVGGVDKLESSTEHQPLTVEIPGGTSPWVISTLQY